MKLFFIITLMLFSINLYSYPEIKLFYNKNDIISPEENNAEVDFSIYTIALCLKQSIDPFEVFQISLLNKKNRNQFSIYTDGTEINQYIYQEFTTESERLLQDSINIIIRYKNDRAFSIDINSLLVSDDLSTYEIYEITEEYEMCKRAKSLPRKWVTKLSYGIM